jgi:hypothetical protein
MVFWAGSAQAALFYDFSTGLQGWTQIYPAPPVPPANSLWEAGWGWGWPENDGLGHLGGGWEDAETWLGRSPTFTLDGSGALTFRFFGTVSPLAAPDVVPSLIPAIATVGGGFMGVALRDIAANEYVLSRGSVANAGLDPALFSDMSFTALELSPFVIPGRQYTLDFIDYDKNPGVGDAWVVMDNVSIPGVPEPATMSLLALGGLGLLRRRRSASS